MSAQTIFNFDKTTILQSWQVVNDDVMGGKSSASLTLTADGHGKFQGKVSLANNGGFSSVRYKFQAISVVSYEVIRLRIKGDGKKYQLRIKAQSEDAYSYVKSFETNGEWQEVAIRMDEMYPSYRGRRLDMNNFAKSEMEEIGILIGNKKEENFQLLIDQITLH